MVEIAQIALIIIVFAHCNQCKLPCLLFADDSLIFCRTNLKSCQKLVIILNFFGQQSRHLINFQKSSLTFSKNVSSPDPHMVSSVFSIKHQDKLGKYLGCPIFKGRKSLETFSEVVNKTATKLQNWKTANISKAGRVALIQTNLESMPAHTMQCFQLLTLACRKIDKISRDFFWKQSVANKGLLLVS